MASPTVLNYLITFSCLVGLGLSIYSYVIELAVEHDKNYKAFCDISEHMSCSKAFKSQYGKGFGLFAEDSFFNKPNSLIGILFYSLVATLTQANSYFVTKLSYWMVFLSNLSSLYFAYILYFKLNNLCVVCVAVYAVNIINLILFNYKVRSLNYEAKSVGQLKKND